MRIFKPPPGTGCCLKCGQARFLTRLVIIPYKQAEVFCRSCLKCGQAFLLQWPKILTFDLEGLRHCIHRLFYAPWRQLSKSVFKVE